MRDVSDIVLDTNILSDVVAQYFAQPYPAALTIQKSSHISPNLARELNRRIRWFSEEWLAYEESDSSPGLIVASVLGFVEIARKFREIANGRFEEDEFRSFISQPPKWFLIASVDATLVRYLCRVPSYVKVDHSHTLVPVEVADALHVATALSRDDALVAATDSRIRAMTSLKNRIIY